MVTSADSLLESKLFKNPHHACERNIGIGISSQDLIDELLGPRHCAGDFTPSSRQGLVLYLLTGGGG